MGQRGSNQLVSCEVVELRLLEVVVFTQVIGCRVIGLCEALVVSGGLGPWKIGLSRCQLSTHLS